MSNPDSTTDTQTFHISDGPDVEATITFDADSPCPQCLAPAHLHGWRLLTTGRGFEVYRCPTCGHHVAIGGR